MKNHIVIEHPEQCCGCGACVNSCPCDAIAMKEDDAGFCYPVVEASRCVQCGKCVDVCVFDQKQQGANGAPAVYAAVINDREVLKDSSSGGVFTALANAVLAKGGAVFGAAWNDDLTVAHVCVEDASDLARLRGSKYVQSATGDAFRQAKKLLKEGKTVFYVGTPCQIAGLKAYLGGAPENLLTADLVCHGVPSMKMLRDDLNYVSDGRLDEIEAVRFRDKQYGWGVKGSVTLSGSKSRYDAGSSPYYFYFLKGEVYRESCYHCRFPSEGRQGDITLGDYWGVRQELLDKMGGVDADLGVSCLLINTEKGGRWLDSVKNTLSITPSDRQSAEKRNKQLTSASVPTPEHEALRDGYAEKGYTAFCDGYKKHGKEHLIRTVKNMIPSKIKRKLNEMLS